VHLHVNDNFGQFEEKRLMDRLSYNSFGPVGWAALGRGDLHLLSDEETVLPYFKPFDGLLIAEVRERFYPSHTDEIVQGLQQLQRILESE
jgi:hypothetical protein